MKLNVKLFRLLNLTPRPKVFMLPVNPSHSNSFVSFNYSPEEEQKAQKRKRVAQELEIDLQVIDAPTKSDSEEVNLKKTPYNGA